MMIKAIIWDLGGVLVRTEDWTPREKLATEFGLTRVELEKKMFDSEGGKQGMLGLTSGDEHWQKLGDSFGLDREILVERFFEGDRLDDKLISAIRFLKNHFKIGLLSNAFSNLRPLLEDDWKIIDVFDEVIISAEVGLVKPDPAIYQLAMKGLDIQAEEAIFVDDFSHNIEAAKQLGIHGVQFESREQAIGDVRRLLAKN